MELASMSEKNPRGYFSFVLHSHLPYVRRAGRWPHGEEMIHEALAETYIPLLLAMDELLQAGVKPRMTLGLTPILLEQIGDPDVLDSFEAYLEEELAGARQDAQRYAGKDEHLVHLAGYYERWYQNIYDSFCEKYKRDVVGGFRRLRDSGYVDVLTCAATHSYFPLVRRDSTIYGQLKTGYESSRRHMGGGRPTGIWLPECGYRPPYFADDGTFKPGVEEFLAEVGLKYFFTETFVVTGSDVMGKVAGDVVGPYGAAPRRRVVRTTEGLSRTGDRTVLRPYYVQTPRVAVYARDPRTGMQVWSASHGYPGDFDYREFHRKDAGSGLQYWRVSGAGVDIGQKEYYRPDWAEAKVKQHAEHFANLVAQSLREFSDQHGRPGCIVSAYDTELFGHWWFEGVTWLREVLRLLDAHPDVGLTTAGAYLEAYPPDEVLNIPESSWGAGGDHSTWLNEGTAWMWPLIHAAEERMERIVQANPTADGRHAELLAQVARELVLLESSDWPFLVSTGQAAEYAIGRFQQHLARFNRLAQAAESRHLDGETERFLRTCQRDDNPFPDIDYRAFANREGRVAAPSVAA
jgi:1,4-alpha-glucan branching enzyme